MCLVIYTSLFFLLSASFLNEPVTGEFHSNSDVQLRRRVKRDAPEIQVPNSRVHAKEGINVSISCIIRAEPVPSVMWKKADGQVIHNNEHYYLETLGHLHTLQIRDLKVQDFGRYECTASNSLGSASENVHIIGTPQVPVITSKPHGSQGTKYTISWTVDSITPVDEYSVTYREKSGNAEWETKVVPATYESENGIYTQMFQLADLKPGTLYEAVVRARNKFGWSKESEVLVFSTKKDDISGVPYFTRPDRMHDQIVRPAGSTVHLRCPVDGKPTPKINWLKDGVPVEKSNYVRVQKWTLRLEHLTTADQGVYTCIASNAEGSISFNFTVEVIEMVPYRPIMLEDYPSNLTVTVGETAVFECRFISDLQPALTWAKMTEMNGSSSDKFNGPEMKIVKSTSTTNTDPKFLILENVALEDAGEYVCIVSNTLGFSKQSAWLTVVPDILSAPYFTKPDRMNEFVVVPAGGTASLRCAAGGDPTPKIIWLKDGIPVENRNNVRVQKWTLRVEHLTAADQGVYTCIASNAEGSISFDFRVEVIEMLPHRPIMLENYPSNLTVTAGETAVFECRFISDLQPALTWAKITELNGSSSDRFNMPNMKIVESTSTTNTDPKLLILENVTLEDAGEYVCIVSNTLGESKQSAWLTVVPVTGGFQPSEMEYFYVLPSNKTVHVGEAATFECKFNGSPDNVEWVKYYEVDGSSLNEFGVPYMKRVQYKSINHIKVNQLTLQNVTFDDAGKYACVVSNNFGNCQRYTWLTVLPKPGTGESHSNSDELLTRRFKRDIPSVPYFTRPGRMRDQVATHAGSNLNLRCPADGNPTPEINWLKDGVPVEKSNYVRMEKWTLRLEYVTAADQGVYTCIASNTEGSISFNFTVEVIESLPYRPFMLEHYPSNLTVAVGETAVFECRFISELHPALKWAKFTEMNRSSSDRFNGPQMKIVESTSTTNTDPKLLILENVTLEDAGEYVCIVSNRYGESKQSAWLTVVPDILSAPYFKKPDRMDERVAVPPGGTASLRCAVGGNPTPKIIWLKDGIPVEKRNNVRVQKWTLRVEHLTAADQGVYSCIASNAQGSISFDFRVEVIEMLPYRPIKLENYPSNLTVTVGETAVFECRFISERRPALKWAKFTEGNGSSFDRFNGPQMKIVESTSTTNTNPRLLILENVALEDAGEYVCIVSNPYGESKQSAWLNVFPE